jgi:hypothetical protein
MYALSDHSYRVCGTAADRSCQFDRRVRETAKCRPTLWTGSESTDTAHRSGRVMNAFQRLRHTVATHNEDGELYLIAGTVTALAGWVVPVLSLVAVGCGYRLFSGDQHRLAGTAIGVLGGLALLRLFLMMAAVL